MPPEPTTITTPAGAAMPGTAGAARGQARAPTAGSDTVTGTVPGPVHPHGKPTQAAAAMAGAGAHASAAGPGAASPPRLADDVPGWLAERLREDAARETQLQRKRLLTRRVLAWSAAAGLLAVVALGGSWLYEERRVDGALVVVANTSPAGTGNGALGATSAADHGTAPEAGGAPAGAGALAGPSRFPPAASVTAQAGEPAETPPRVPPGVTALPAVKAQAADPVAAPLRVPPGVTALPAISARVADTATVMARASDTGRAGPGPAEEGAGAALPEAAGVTQRPPPKENRPPKRKRRAAPPVDAAGDNSDAPQPSGAALQHKRPQRHTTTDSRMRAQGAPAAGADADTAPAPDRRREETLMQCRVLGYDERQCERHGCEMTRFGLACRG